MSMGESLGPADIAALTNGNRNNYGSNGFGGAEGAWWIIIFVLFFAFGGWGNGARNGGGNGNGGSDVTIVPVNGGGYGFGGGFSPCCTPATQQQMSDAFNFSKLDNITSAISTGICDSTYALNNAINSVNSTVADCCCKTQTNMLQGFNGVDRSLCSGFNSVNTNLNNGFNSVNSNLNNLGFQLQQCCCDTQKEIIESRNQDYRNTCDIINNQTANTQRIIDKMTQSEIDALRTNLQSAQLQLSQLSQTDSIVNALRTPTPVPAYLTCSPYQSAQYAYNNLFGNNCCGCGC